MAETGYVGFILFCVKCDNRLEQTIPPIPVGFFVDYVDGMFNRKRHRASPLFDIHWAMEIGIEQLYICI